MPYIVPEIITEARRMDLLTYLRAYEPNELVRFSGNTYTTRTHDSLKISNGKWMWWSRGIGGNSALDYLVKVKGLSFLEAVETIMGGNVALPIPIPTPKENAPKVLLLPDKSNTNDVITEYLFGRGIDYAVSLEGSLKMKEISYIHSEAYAAGELKHGPISLIEDGTLVISVITQQALFEKTVSNMQECKSRGAYIMGLTTYGNYSVEDNADFTVYIPKTDPLFAATLAVVPLQLMGYYVSVAKGLDVDKPRNLAKSVTVE